MKLKKRCYQIYPGLCLLLGMMFPPAVSALTCFSQDGYGNTSNTLASSYEPDVEHIFKCDTMMVRFGDTTVLTGGGGTSFRWDDRLRDHDKVLWIMGVVKGKGIIGFGGQSNSRDASSRWGGILVDSCASVKFEQLVVVGATQALQLRSFNVSVDRLELEKSGGIVLPDSSLLAVRPTSDVLTDFNGADLPGAQAHPYKCPDPPNKKRSVAKEKSSNSADEWTTADILYWTGLASLMIIEVIAIYIYKKG